MDITSQQLVAELNKVITDFINSAKLNKKKITRDDVIEMISERLREIIEENKDQKDKVLLISGMAMGIAMVLQVEVTLSENKF